MSRDTRRAIDALFEMLVHLNEMVQTLLEQIEELDS